MTRLVDGRALRPLLLALLLTVGGVAQTQALAQVRTAPDQTTSPSTAKPPAAPAPPAATPPSATPTVPPAAPVLPGTSPNETTPRAATPKPTPPAPTTTPTGPGAPDAAPGPAPAPLAPGGKPQPNEIERNGSPGVPDNATTENVDVPARPVVIVKGQSTYDDAFKSIKASLDTVKRAMDKAGLKPAGHPITIFSEPDDKGFKFQAGVPLAARPDKPDLGDGVTAATSPAGKAIKFQHRGAYEDIDSTYDVITAFLDAKGMQVDSPYIEEYLTDLTTPDDPNLQVDIYVFVK